ncbi:heterokaryon incompatibility protein-domain-containing protein [Neurospora tetraspora]|uniref:Heterokaryon incompatibility protein-domain-containing protein n=1 Tax=Neurospora tetraspora TaxID=94610 RepID=A0AAE0MR81_9PEZI|nr:heterokaryon incompatibility protein-domain-containing protein [Neurospora tetraspora]
MRLLHTISLNLVEFIEDIPRARYAILSHTWGEDEVSFRDLTYDIERSKKGWRKITNACEYAASRGWEYIWIDTCCIDKSDPTELSLAINSMFRWYEASGVCYAYLSDVMSPATVSNRSRVSWFRADEFDAFSRSRWFRRGWTLQELLAPDVLEFLYEDWTPIASREDMASEMQKGTGITSDHLANFRMCSLATKLSWAANRETTRVEDRSYSLLGLLGVHMPLIYGEGENAFVRLQHELIRKYNDESIFVWDGEIGTERGVPVGELRSGSCLFPVLTSNPQRVADESLSPTTLRIRSKILQVS